LVFETSNDPLVSPWARLTLADADSLVGVAVP
jgi:hypothetical protein